MRAEATSGSGGSHALVHRAGELTAGPYAVELTARDCGWQWAGLRILTLPPGGRHELTTGEEEMAVLPLTGSASVVCDGEKMELRGRDDVFTSVSDFAYLPRDAVVGIESATGGTFALPAARCKRRLPARYVPAADVAVEVRGAGRCSRQVNNFMAADAFEADNLIAVEVLTPAGNWSSFPPHKHDTELPGESVLEEIYYFGLGPAVPPAAAARGLGYHRVYASDERPVDVMAEIGDGDAVLVPYGWHGPCIAPPAHHMYYLNVMAGPGPDRAWKITDDPDHAWIRGTWDRDDIDPRLPLASPGGKDR